MLKIKTYLARALQAKAFVFEEEDGRRWKMKNRMKRTNLGDENVDFDAYPLPTERTHHSGRRLCKLISIECRSLTDLCAQRSLFLLPQISTPQWSMTSSHWLVMCRRGSCGWLCNLEHQSDRTPWSCGKILYVKRERERESTEFGTAFL